jgi:hypothetical protein
MKSRAVGAKVSDRRRSSHIVRATALAGLCAWLCPILLPA